MILAKSSTFWQFFYQEQELIEGNLHVAALKMKVLGPACLKLSIALAVHQSTVALPQTR